MSSERVKPYEQKMEKTLSHLENDLQAVRAGRANPHVLDKIRVDYYGSPTPIQQLANVSVPEARIIQISPQPRDRCIRYRHQSFHRWDNDQTDFP